LADVLQQAHEEACDKFEEGKKERRQRKKPTAASAVASETPSTPKTAHDLVREANAYTDAAIEKLRETILVVGENDAGTYAKGLLSQALKAATSAKSAQSKFEERLTALEATIMQMQDGKDSDLEDGKHQMAFALGRAFGALNN